jgi:hypothetical protein
MNPTADFQMRQLAHLTEAHAAGRARQESGQESNARKGKNFKCVFRRI